MNKVQKQVDQLYKEESARLLAVLVRIFGPQNFDLAEDTLQEAFGRSLIHWQQAGIPPKPAAWIMKTAKNIAIDTIRANRSHAKFSKDITLLLESEWSLSGVVEYEFDDDKIKDDQLRMIFMCCHNAIKPENRVPFILRHLCGFSIPAISRALLLQEATIKKRLLRTKERVKELFFELPEVSAEVDAMDSVHTVLYLLFNEGFHCTSALSHINIRFCQEAINLLQLVINEPAIANQESLALMALMHFTLSRINAVVDTDGNRIPIDLQDREQWNKATIESACQYLSMPYHAGIREQGRFYYEALIAKEHCIAKTFALTNWERITELYNALYDVNESPIVALNRAIAQAYAGDIVNAIKSVEQLQSNTDLKHSHMPQAILAHLYAMNKNQEAALFFAAKAKEKGGTPGELRVMMKQIERHLADG